MIKKHVRVYDSLITGRLMYTFSVECEFGDQVNPAIDLHISKLKGYRGYIRCSVHSDNIWNRFISRLILIKGKL